MSENNYNQAVGAPLGVTELPATVPMAWYDRVLTRLARIAASPRFQRFAPSFLLTRPVARYHGNRLYDLCAGFIHSQVLAACIELNIFERLREGPGNLAVLALDTAVPADRLQRLLDAAVSLGLLIRRPGNRYALGVLGASVLGNPGVPEMVRHHARLYRDLADPVALLRDQSGGRDRNMTGYWPYAANAQAAALTGADVAEYTDLMAASQALVANEVIASGALKGVRSVLDIGGGDGTFLRTIAKSLGGQLSLHLFDLPAVADIARDRGGAITPHGGDFLRDEFPQDVDCVTLVRILLDHGDDTVSRLLANVRRSMRPDARLVIAEPMSQTPGGGGRVADGYFGLYLMAMGEGRPRTPAAIGHLLKVAGFDEVKVLRTNQPMIATVITARPT